MSDLRYHTRDYVAAIGAERADRARSREADELRRLVRAAANGQEAAWSALVRRFARRLAALARSHRLPAQDVDDVVQCTFVRLYDHIDTLRDAAALPAWLDTTARRESLRVIRSAARERPMAEDFISDLPAPEPDHEPLGDECRAELTRALQDLSEREGKLLALLHGDPPLSYSDISEALGMPVGSIGPTRARALARLRRDGRLAAAAALELT